MGDSVGDPGAQTLTPMSGGQANAADHVETTSRRLIAQGQGRRQSRGRGRDRGRVGCWWDPGWRLG